MGIADGLDWEDLSESNPPGRRKRGGRAKGPRLKWLEEDKLTEEAEKRAV